MKKIILSLVLFISAYTGSAQKFIYQDKNVSCYFYSSYVNTVEKGFCEFDQYKITVYIYNKTSKKIYTGLSDLNWGDVVCYDSRYVGGKSVYKRKGTNDVNIYGITVDPGKKDKRVGYILIPINDKPSNANWSFEYEFRN